MSIEEKIKITDLLLSAARKYRPGASFTLIDLYMAEPRLHDYSPHALGRYMRLIFDKDENIPRRPHDRTYWLLRT